MTGNAILQEGRRLTMPVNDRRFAALIGKINQKSILGTNGQAVRAVGLLNAEHFGGTTVDIQDAFGDGKLFRQPGRGWRRDGHKAKRGWCRGKQCAARDLE
jgi:hypothetical protein